jgi:hypothetical protein
VVPEVLFADFLHENIIGTSDLVVQRVLRTKLDFGSHFAFTAPLPRGFAIESVSPPKQVAKYASPNEGLPAATRQWTLHLLCGR